MSEKKSSSVMETYQTISETVGGVPNVNPKDNLYQGLFVLVCSVLAFLAGYLTTSGPDRTTIGFVFMLLGLIGSGLLSGTVLMVAGFVRAARKK